MRYAITPKGFGRRPGARAIEDNWALVAGETFSVPEAGYNPSLVLGDDGLSLRPKTEAELGLDLTAAAAAAVEQDAQAALAADARVDAVFDQLKNATAAQISAFVNARFDTPSFTAPQRAVIKLLLQVAALTLRRS